MTQHRSDASVGVVYDAKVLGAPFKVLLAEGFKQKKDENTGKVTTEIEDLTGLLAAVVCARVLHPRKLSGPDLKFVRSALGLKSRKVAERLDVTPEYYSRCENGAGTLSNAAEKQLRMESFLRVTLCDKNLERISTELDGKPKMTEEEVEFAASAFKKIFLEMKIEAIYRPEEELSFVFHRCRRGDSAEPSREDKWLNPALSKAA